MEIFITGQFVGATCKIHRAEQQMATAAEFAITAVVGTSRLTASTSKTTLSPSVLSWEKSERCAARRV